MENLYSGGLEVLEHQAVVMKVQTELLSLKCLVKWHACSLQK